MGVLNPPRDEKADAKFLSNVIKIVRKPDSWYMDNISSPDTGLAQNSINTYMFDMTRILGDLKAKSIHNLLTHPKKYGNLVYDDESYSVERRATIFRTILAFMKHANFKEAYPLLVDMWRLVSSKAYDAVMDMKKSNIPTKRQENGMVRWEDILKMRDSFLIGSEKHLILCLYTYVPPRRQLDYANFRIYTDPSEDPPKDHNHIHLYSDKYKSPYIFVDKYKTVKNYDAFFNADIPKDFIDAIKVSLEMNPRRYLIVSPKTKGAFNSVNSYTKHVNKILKDVFNNENFTVNSFRHSASTFRNGLPNISLAEHELYALKMGHSGRQNREYSFVTLPSSNKGGKIDDVGDRNKKEKVEQEQEQEQERKKKREIEIADAGKVEECYKRVGRSIEKIDCPK